jgi:hypothetical protein
MFFIVEQPLQGFGIEDRSARERPRGAKHSRRTFFTFMPLPGSNAKAVPGSVEPVRSP